MESDGRIRSKDIGTGEVNSRVIDDLRSSNYDGSHTDPENDPGLVGWQILKSGFMVINNAVVRGTIAAARITSALIESGIVRLTAGGRIELGGDPETGTPATAVLSETGMVVGPTSLTASGVTVGDDVVIDSTGLLVEGGLVSAISPVSDSETTTNFSLTTTFQTVLTASVTFPAWVEQAIILANGFGRMTESVDKNIHVQILNHAGSVVSGPIITTVPGALVGGATGTLALGIPIVETVSGAVTTRLQARVNGGTNSVNDFALSVLALGLRL